MAKSQLPSVPVQFALAFGAWYLYSPEQVREFFRISGKKLTNAVKSTPTSTANPSLSTGATVPGLVPLGPGAGRYQPDNDFSWISNPSAFRRDPAWDFVLGVPPYNGVPIGFPNLPPSARRPPPPSSRVGTDPATGQPATSFPRSPVAPPIAGLPAANIRDPYLEQFPVVLPDTYGGSYNPWAGSATQYLNENQQPTNNYDYASTLPSGSATQYLTETSQPSNQDSGRRYSPPAETYSGGDGYSSNNQSVSYDQPPPAYDPPEAPAYEPVDPPEEDYGGSYNPYDQGQPDETYGGGDNPWTDDIYNNRGE